MREDILTPEQLALLPLLKLFSDKFCLIGGTAIALHLGHRKSIDFDLLTNHELEIEAIRSMVRDNFNVEAVLVETTTELTIVVNQVKITFLKYPFMIEASARFGDIINLPNLEVLAAMKAYALGRRAKWKDYVDMYFIFKVRPIGQIAKKASDIFGPEFNEKLFREQLAYFEDIDYSETVDYIAGHEVADDEVKQALIRISLQK